MIAKVRLPIRVAEGTRAKLDFDFACGRGHSFGEYHVHGVINEILCSNLDPMQYRVNSGFPHRELQTAGVSGRRREVDFAVTSLVSGAGEFYAEVKWAGSSHCTQDRVLRDLCRLQLIKNAEQSAECIFVLAGRSKDVEHLFGKGLLKEGTQCLLHKNNSSNNPIIRGSRKRVKRFLVSGNIDHATQIQTLINDLLQSLPTIPNSICTYLAYSAQSAPEDSRFQTLVWSLEAG